MLSREVNITKRVVTPHGKRYCPVVFSGNGRIKQDTVLVDGREERHPEGAYYIDWRDNGRRIRQSVGKNAPDALSRKLRQAQILASKALGIAVLESSSNNALRSKRRPTAESVTTYLEEIRLSRTPATHSAYALALRNFTDCCRKESLEEIERIDLLRYVSYLKKDLGLSDRTCHNRFEHLLTFLKAQSIRQLATKRDWPRYVQTEPESYDDEELKRFFEACTTEERVFFEFYLMTGFRKKEVTYTCWSDIDVKQGVVRVTAKPEYGFRPKDWEEREVPVPDKLVTSLKNWATTCNGSPFVFPTRNGTPRKHRTQLLDLCKEIAGRAGMDRDKFFLHKFRATFATNHLQAGVDLRTVQMWLGHKDLESTMRYLRPARGKAIREKVNNTFATA